MNTTIISGNIGSVKEVATVGNSKVLNFSVAVNKHFTKNNEKVTETVWYECALWNRENIYPFLKPGTNVLVQGEVGARAYADTKNDNKPIAVLTCSVETIEFWNKQDGTKE
jgi:single-strand DNA-binding protein